MEGETIERVPTPPLPPDTVPLVNQISGHFYGQKATKLGMLQLKDGSIVKPLIPPKGDKELVFYCSVCQPTGRVTDDMKILKPLLPKYSGLWSTPVHPGINYIKLENITKKFTKPCIMDVKVGPVTWEPTATEEKKIREMNKYPSQQEVGFRLLGIKVYRHSTGDYFSIGHLDMRKLNADQVLPDGILPYLDIGTNPTYKSEIVRVIVAKLQHVLDWFNVQTTYHFYASSLLFVYEGLPNSLDASVNCHNLVDIRLIDFTHVFPANGRRDENYITGVSKLLLQFEYALKVCS